MFKTEQIKPYVPLNTQNILKLITEEDIFRFYCNGAEIQVGGLILSPLRQDKSPTCSFYYRSGKLRIKDFATGYSGDCFDLVQQLYGCNFKQSLEIINKDFNLGLGTHSNLKLQSLSPKKMEKIEDTAKQRLNLQVNITSYSEEDLKFWKKYGITYDTLKKFRVYSVKEMFINGKLVLRKRLGNLIFAYHFPKSDNIKVYQPYSEYKWTSNATAEDIQGLEMFVPDSDLIITSSLKDVMILYELGYNAVAPQGEGNRFTKTMEELIENSKNVYLFYDNDEPGIINARARMSEYPKIKDFFILPGLEKDPSDYVKANGKNALKEFLCQRLNFL